MLRSLLFMLALASLAACNTTKPLPARVNDLLVFPAVSNIRTIRINNKQEEDSILSINVAEEITSGIKELLPTNVRQTDMSIPEAVSAEYLKAITSLVKETNHQDTYLYPVKPPEKLLHILDSTGHDFGLIIVDQGYLRTDQNEVNQYAKKRTGNLLLMSFLGFLSFKTSPNSTSVDIYSSVPDKSSSAMICFIIDKKKKSIRYYKKEIWPRRDPTDNIVIRSQLHHLLMSYFQLEK